MLVLRKSNRITYFIIFKHFHILLLLKLQWIIIKSIVLHARIKIYKTLLMSRQSGSFFLHVYLHICRQENVLYVFCIYNSMAVQD